MKKQILSPLCSAFIIPGLGQILNHHLKKGVTILAIVFILFIAGTIMLYQLLKGQVMGGGLDSRIILEKALGVDYRMLWILLIAFAIVWLYSVLDAFRAGKKIDNMAGDDEP